VLGLPRPDPGSGNLLYVTLENMKTVTFESLTSNEGYGMRSRNRSGGGW
jgi:hypothetical protein